MTGRVSSCINTLKWKDFLFIFYYIVSWWEGIIKKEQSTGSYHAAKYKKLYRIWISKLQNKKILVRRIHNQSTYGWEMD